MRVSDLFDDEVLGLESSAPVPPERLQRSVTACAQSELLNPTPFLGRGEVVLTLGMGMHFHDHRIWDAYVERLDQAGTSALAFGLGTVHHSVPEGLVAACTRHGLPLIVLPPEFPLVKLSRHIWQELAAERFEIARQGWELADECAQAATRGAPLARLLEHVAEAIQARASIVDDAGHSLVMAQPDGFAPSRPARSTLRLPGGEHARFVLTVESEREMLLLQPLLGPASAVIAMQLSYTLTSRSPLHSHTSARFFERLLDSPGGGLDALVPLALDAGFITEQPWSAITLRLPPGMSNAVLRLATWRLRVQLEERYRQVRFYDEAYHATLVMQGPLTPLDLPAIVSDTLRSTPGLDAGYTTGLSFTELPLSIQAARRAPLIAGVRPMRQIDLMSIVDALPSAGLAEIARRRFEPLEQAEGPLLETLTAFLELSGATRAVCERLFIHRNTLSYRLRRIEDLLDVDLDDGKVRATLLLALQILGKDTVHSA